MRIGPRQFTRAAALKLALMLLCVGIPAITFGSTPTARPFVLLVVGAAGDETYQPTFATNEKLWREAAAKGGAEVVTVGLDGSAGAESDADRKKFQSVIEGFRQTNSAPAWIVLIGHGTDNGKEAKFNLRGPDFSAAELAEWLKVAVFGDSACGGVLL